MGGHSYSCLFKELEIKVISTVEVPFCIEMIDAFQEMTDAYSGFFQVGKRSSVVISQDRYAIVTQMLGNCSQIACTQTACFQREAGAEVLRFNLAQ